MESDTLPLTMQQIKPAIREALKQRIRDLETWDHEALQRINRVRVPIEDLPAMQWLSSQTIVPKLYWANRNHEFRMAGVGSVHTLTSENPPELATLVASMVPNLTDLHPHLRYYGGFQFDLDKSVDDEWQAFGAYRFTIPEFELYRKPGSTYFAWNFHYDPEDPDILEKLYARLEEVQFDLVLPDWEEHVALLRSNNPEKDEWIRMIQKALDDLQTGAYEKIVLARRAILEFADNLDPLAFILRLRMLSEDTFNYFFQPDAKHAFLGASPERLFRRNGRDIVTEAIAGTRARGKTPGADRRLEADLLSSDKELREHGYVVNMIRKELSPLTEKLDSDEEVSVTQLAHVQHLCKQFRGVLMSGVSDADILKTLHPTPATGGFPKTEAMAAIPKLESFARGWYAGAVGYFGYDEAEFVVAIRSALVEETRIKLFSGAGIVRGSDPQAEWQEVEDKISKFLKALDR